MTDKIIIFGTGKMAQLANFYFSRDSRFEVAAFTVDGAYLSSERLWDLPLVRFETVEEAYPPDKFKMFVAIGYRKLNALRASKYAEAKRKGYELVSYVSSRSMLWGDTEIGDNCFIFENQVIQPFVKIGSNNIIWSGNHIGHDVVIGDHCFLASHIVVSSGVKIGDNSYIGINASLRDNVVIGRECIVGAGAVILNNTKDREVYVAKQTELYRLDSEQFERMMEISR